MAFERTLPNERVSTEVVVFDHHDDIAWLWLNRPQTLNATTGEMVTAINRALDELNASPPRVLVLGGLGRAFCAGRDLGEANPEAEDAHAILANWYNPLIVRLASLETITVAAAHGAVLGTGLGLALACDLVVTTTSSRWGSPFGRIGAVLDSGGHYFFANLGIPRAFGLILLGELIDGNQAFEYGLASRVIDDARFDEELDRMVGHLANGPTQAFLASKRILNTERLPQLRRILDLEAAEQGRCATTADYQAGIRAFIERREPRFEGR
jgi:2-(1,2-epoxy-1,2-dihydrophenyl)acetyl-CoA isomerase